MPYGAVRGGMETDNPLIDALLDAIENAAVLARADGRVVRANGRFQQINAAEGAVMAPLRGPLTQASQSPAGWNAAIACLGPDGEKRRLATQVWHVDGAEAGPDQLLLAILEDKSETGVGHDTLTGLANRFLFLDRTGQALLNARRAGKSVALLMIGLDRFARVNDALGHAFGDTILKVMAERLLGVIRQTDTGARLDGDKFALITPITSADDSVIVAEKVLKAVQEPFHIEGQEVVVTTSVGISVFPTDGDHADLLIKHADFALHHANASGRNQYQFYAQEMNTRAQHRLQLERDMRRALQNDEFLVYFQPKISAGNKIKGMEALIRWKDPFKGMVSPAEFIPVAEETGLIEEIGTWVMQASCRQTKAWQDMGLPSVRCSVNVSAHQFRSRHIVEKVKAALAESGLEADWLELEITESMLMNNVEEVVAKMQALRDLGVNLSIDDFGTGYSSLSYLGRFPITTLKIDRAFVHDVESNPNTAEIARAIIGLSRGLALEVVAEGAELAEQVQFLRDNGCDVVQGFFFSRPLPAHEFEALLRKQMEAELQTA
jgi:diguanylate cyclase (GGDEF)-like protein